MNGHRDTQGKSLPIILISMTIRTVYRHCTGWKKTLSTQKVGVLVNTHTFAEMFSGLIVSLSPWCDWCLINSSKVFHLLCFVFQMNLKFVVIFDTQHI